MSGRALNQNLLEGGDFTSLSQDVQVNLEDIEYNKQSIDEIAHKIKNDDKINDRMLIQYKSSMKKMDTLIPQTELILDNLSNVCYSRKEQNIHKKLQDVFEQRRDDYLEQKQELEYLVKDKKLDRRMKNIPDRSLQGSMLSSIDATEQMQEELPVLQVYDQEKFVNNRTEKVKKIKNDARDLNNLAVQIHQKVEEQDGMLDSLNKDLEANKKQVVEANQNLFEAAQTGEQSRKTQWMCLLLLAVVVSGIGIYLLFKAGIIGGGDSDKTNRLLRI